jgi:Flp pilus assembly protein TadG
MLIHFFKNKEGVTGSIFAFGLIPIISLAGAATDYSLLTSAKSALQSTADSAALAALANTTSNPETTRATNFFNANAAQRAELLSPSITFTVVNTDKVRVNTSATVRSYFPITNGNRTITATATAVRGSGTNSNFTIQAQFVFSDAWDGNEIFLYRMDAQTKQILETKLIASNMTKQSYNVDMSIGSGEAYGFKMTNTRCGVRSYGNSCGVKTDYYSHTNPTNSFKVSGTPCSSPETTHYWEDTPIGGDGDYNDMVYKFSCIGSPPIGGMSLVRLEQ